jgi:hypothetical protein
MGTSELSLKFGNTGLDKNAQKKEIMVINELAFPLAHVKPPLGKTERSYAPQGQGEEMKVVKRP